MKTLKRTISVTAVLLSAITLLSWNFNKSGKEAVNSNATLFYNSGNQPDMHVLGFMESAEQYKDPVANYLPGAEDVLIKRIPGDNNHLLMMAFYSKENFSAPSFTIHNGSAIIFKDDGKGYDEKAGDGLYTARIDIDVKEFRGRAISIAKRMKENGYKPFRYINRELVYDPEVSETFSTESFDNNKAVSISGITNSLAMGDSGTGKETLLQILGHNSIFITDLGVVEDTLRTWNFCTQKGNVKGAWTFGELMRQLASSNPGQIATDAQLSDFVKNWLNTWVTDQVVNGDTVQARTLMTTQIVNPWLNKSKAAGAPTGQLDMHFCPFKLTAIVNRFDLRDGMKFTDSGQFCGQGRLMFCAIKNDCTSFLNMTIIFEYGINKPNTCDAKKAWAQQWFNLKDLALGSPQYNQALQAITDQFTLCGTNISRPNQSSIAQVRTNEITLSPSPKVWELKEFIIDATTGALKQNTVGQTPADRYDSQIVNNDVKRMVAFVNQNRANITAGHYIVPAQWQGFGFLGGASRILGKPTGIPPAPFHWDGTDSTNKPTFISSNTARGNFSFQTCSGCHAGETQTSFTHVDPVFFGTQATLSGFLTGKAGKGGAIDFDNDSTNSSFAVKDAALRPSPSNPTIKTFNDINRRAADIKGFVNTSCGSVLGISSQLMFKPVNMVH